MSAIPHCTAPLLVAMKLRPAAAEAGRCGDNALGPWSMTLLHARPQKLALAVCHASRHAFVMPAAPLAALPQRFGPALLQLLVMLGAEADAARREAAAMQPLVIAPTVERGVRSHMGQYKDLVLWLLARGDSLSAINERLALNLVMRPATFHVGERTFELLGLGPSPLRELEHNHFGRTGPGAADAGRVDGAFNGPVKTRRCASNSLPSTRMLSRDFKEFAELLNSEGVEYLVVGGYALAAHGHPRYTGDFDIWLRVTPANLQRLLAVLQRFGFGSLGLRSADFEAPGAVVQLGYPPGRIDLLTGIDGVDFDACHGRRMEVEVVGVRLPILGLEDFKANKRAVGRAKDLADLESLGEPPEPRAAD